MSTKTPLRIGIIQYDPKITEVQANMNRIRGFLQNVRKGSLDLLCLPETALTGYVFPTPEDVIPYLEEPKVGVTSQFCQELAQSLGCYVLAGYPEKLTADEERPGKSVGANSAIFYDGNGDYVGGTRKTNMFTADLPWVKPGTGFAYFNNLSSPLDMLSLGICMDLNPSPDHMEWPTPCELASFALANRSRVLVLICAWLQSEEDPSSPWCLTTIDYWINRLLPLWSEDSPELCPMAQYPAPDDHDETTVVICNRTGLERGSQFAGCSMVIRCSRKKGKWDIVGLANKSFEGLLTLTVE